MLERMCRNPSPEGALLHCWWECKLVQPLWRTVSTSLQKLRTEISYDPATPFLGLYLEQKLIHKDVHTSTIYSSQDTETI